MAQIHRRMHKADITLAILLDVIQEDNHFDRVEISIGAYKNGREDGYSVRCNEKLVRFSENRRSDEIVVYFEPDDTYNDDLTEAGYKNKTYFDAEAYAEAAKSIYEFFKQSGEFRQKGR